MPFSDLSDNLLLEIAFWIRKGDTWCSFATLNSRCRVAALSAQLAIGKKFIVIDDHHSSTVKALEEPTKELLNAIRNVRVTSHAITNFHGTVNEYKFGLNHLRSLIIGSTMLDTLCFTGGDVMDIPLITILNLLASLQTHSGRLTDVQHNRIRFLSLRDIAYFHDCRNISPMGLAGLEVLHIYRQRWQGWLTLSEDVPSQLERTCEVLGKMIRAARYTLQSLKMDFSRDIVLEKFDIRMLAGDEGDVKAWKHLRKLRMSILVEFISPFDDFVGTLDAIADMFPNLEVLELITFAPDNRFRYTPGILKPLSKLKSLHCLKLALDFERDSNDELDSDDELDEDPDPKWYNRCLRRRYTATQAIANVCPLTRCYWKHRFNGNNQWYRFLVENESGAGKPDDSDSSWSHEQAGNRVVKTRMSWWMEPHRKCDLGGDLPCEVVGSAEEENMASDSDDFVE
ncbi:hypothetical protein K435DRAFT_969287 [Dendrothele bispora CBS 962.96]|uniref:Uncharacterized protein n=1 Tax=Dendrothele bispora (strain CBS 962.96) TaxID=1314807 RepID=A0A4S8LJF9_DENBC|nr:hypothetical protein K435DRAFT_969287 [Dendrothele bispora CBS 962.96]